MNILITSVSKKVLLIKSFKTNLNNYNAKLIVTDCNINSPALYFGDEYFISPKVNDESYLDFMLNACSQYQIKLIIPTSDRELLFFSENYLLFNNINCKVLVSSKETIVICQNKNNFNDFCLANNIPIPKTYKNLEENVSLPVFIKPIYGSSSQNIKKINKLIELKEIDFNKYVVQEYIECDEYTIDYLGDFEGNFINCVPRQRISVINGESCVSKINNIKVINKYTKLLGEKLKLCGHNTLQCFFDGKQVKMIEINPRFGGAGNLGINGGLNSPQIIIDILHGKKINYENVIKDSLIMMRYSKDIFGYIHNGVFNSEDINYERKIFCIDIDGTLCSENCKYEHAQPIKKVINKINKLFEKNKIILFTARGYTSKTDWRNLTETQLSKWGVKYHELIFNKPFADYYIDNKGIDILEWI